MMKKFFRIFAILMFSVVFAQEPQKIHIDVCGQGFDDLKCIIEEVTVNCKIDRVSTACKLKRGVDYTMKVHFTPDFEGSDNITMIAYALLPKYDAKFKDIDEDACKLTPCPIVKNVRNTYTLNLNISPKFPISIVNTRWLMSQNGQPKCCFVNKFKIEGGL